MKKRFNVLCDLDGVLHRGEKALPGAARFVRELQKSGRNYLFLTNSPDSSPRELHFALKKFRIDVPESRFYTSAKAMAAFIASHSDAPRVYVVGSKALRAELEAVGAKLTARDAEYVVVATGGRYDLSAIDKAVELVLMGAKFLAPSSESASLTEDSIEAGSGALTAPIERVTGCRPYVVGKPNHLMIRAAERQFGIDPLRTLMIGDSLDTDVDVGQQAQMKTVLLLSGITSREMLNRSAYCPDYVFKDISHVHLNRLP